MDQPNAVSTGNRGLDTILKGGLPVHRLYFLEGTPGSGKTTLALQFLREGARLGERALYITLSETREELAVVAASHGWDLDAFDVFEMSAAADVFGEGQDQTIFHPWEMELGETIKLIQNEVERVRPQRVEHRRRRQHHQGRREYVPEPSHRPPVSPRARRRA